MNLHAKIATRTEFHRSRITFWRYFAVRFAFLAIDIVFLLPLIFLSVCARFVRRPIDVGLGPIPLINSIYHKKCFEHYGYSCETFVDTVWHVTQDFDVKLAAYFPNLLRPLIPYVLFVFTIFRYRCLYVYFSGGPLRWTTMLAYLEPFLLNIANIRTVVLAYGADVQELSRTENLRFVDAMALDYPGFRHNRRRIALLIDMWTHGADHIVAGCDWVDYLYYWDSLLLSHFAIDLELFPDHDPAVSVSEPATSLPLCVLHAPNHPNIKGTSHLIDAVKDLQAEGINIELRILEGVPNSEVLRAIRDADVIVDQLIVGWYAMFSLEAMAMNKPVVCYLRQDFYDLFVGRGIVKRDEIPIINASVFSIKDVLRELALLDRSKLSEIGHKSRQFAEKYHSIEAIGRIFANINRSLSLEPSVMRSPRTQSHSAHPSK